jgi:hypothetical protein
MVPKEGPATKKNWPTDRQVSKSTSTSTSTDIETFGREAHSWVVFSWLDVHTKLMLSLKQHTIIDF